MKNRDKIEEMAQKLVISNLTPREGLGRISDIYDSTVRNVVKRSISVSIAFYNELDNQMSAQTEPDKTAS